MDGLYVLNNFIKKNSTKMHQLKKSYIESIWISFVKESSNFKKNSDQ